MINLLINLLLGFLRLFNFFGILDNIAVVYGVMIAVAIGLDRLLRSAPYVGEAYSEMKTGTVVSIFILNALPQWWCWLLGLAIFAGAWAWHGLASKNKGRKKRDLKKSIVKPILDRLDSWIYEDEADNGEPQK